MEEGRDDVKLGDFLAEISLLTDQDTDKSENSSRVTMMTVHSAKGLEFKNVFVVGLEEDLFPSERSDNNPKEIEEERRLFYVAITRAEENVILTYAKSRFRNGQSLTCYPSRFIDDIDPVYLQTSGDKFQNPVIPRLTRDPLKVMLPNVEVKPYFKDSGVQGIAGQARNDKIKAIGLSIGNTIRHERFGLGKVVELSGESENARATVEFESFGRKQLLLKFAKYDII
jgi:DNA helicase-2/ATP-dependent DNA helicase PcrA